MKSRVFLTGFLIALAAAQPVFAMKNQYLQAALNGTKTASVWGWNNLGKPALKGTAALGAALGVPVAAGALTGMLTNALLAQKAGTNAFGIGVGALTSLLVLNEGGHIIADGAYAKLQGKNLAERYKHERDILAKLWRDTLDYLLYLKGRIQPFSSNWSPQGVPAVSVQLFSMGSDQNQKNISEIVGVSNDLIGSINSLFEDYKSSYKDIPGLIAYKNLHMDVDLSSFVRTNPYCAQRAWYRYDRFFAGIMDHALNDAEKNEDFKKFEKTFNTAIEAMRSSQKASPEDVAKRSKDLKESVNGILNILEKNLADLNWKAKRLEWIIRIADAFGW